jgi:glutaminyl-peptide cyclotransferase
VSMRLELRPVCVVLLSVSCAAFAAACGSNSWKADAHTAAAPATGTGVSQGGSNLPNAPDPGVDGFSGQRAFEQVQKQVDFGPRPPGTEAIHKLQDYMIAHLRSDGCQVDSDDFHANTPVGSVAMKNIVAKIPGASPNIILLGTHYDTDTLDEHDQKMTNFVGADDAGSSTGVMLEIARVLCAKSAPKPADTIWIAFFDGEEALQHWVTDVDGTYGSREMAAQLALSGQLPKVKAFVLADMVGGYKLQLRRESNSAPWLVDIIWNNAAKLGFQSVFLNETTGVGDDHTPFVERHVPSVDIIETDPSTSNSPAEGFPPYWHTPGDTLDKVSPRSLQIVGDVILASLPDIARHAR